jgi:hypothetical protein
VHHTAWSSPEFRRKRRNLFQQQPRTLLTRQPKICSEMRNTKRFTWARKCVPNLKLNEHTERNRGIPNCTAFPTGAITGGILRNAASDS